MSNGIVVGIVNTSHGHIFESILTIVSGRRPSRNWQDSCLGSHALVGLVGGSTSTNPKASAIGGYGGLVLVLADADVNVNHLAASLSRGTDRAACDTVCFIIGLSCSIVEIFNVCIDMTFLCWVLLHVARSTTFGIMCEIWYTRYRVVLDIYTYLCQLRRSK